MQLFRNAIFLVSTGVVLLALAAPASAAYLVTLTNGESISAKDYKVNGRTIELKMEGGSASFPRSLVASISAGGGGGNLFPPSSAAKAPAKAGVKTPEKADVQADAQPLSLYLEPGSKTPEKTRFGTRLLPPEALMRELKRWVKPRAKDDMTVGEFLDKEEREDGDDSVDAADQDGTSEDYQGFMPEDADQGDKVTEEQKKRPLKGAFFYMRNSPCRFRALLEPSLHLQGGHAEPYRHRWVPLHEDDGRAVTEYHLIEVAGCILSLIIALLPSLLITPAISTAPVNWTTSPLPVNRPVAGS